VSEEVTRKRRDREATRGRILKAATTEFSRFGFAGARGERIAQRARSSERMLYYYFGSKEGLFRAALEAVYSALRDAERGLRLDEQPPLEALDGFCRFVWRYYVDHPAFISLVNTRRATFGSRQGCTNSCLRSSACWPN
jgi:AcrR family transcriptional regulator